MPVEAKDARQINTYIAEADVIGRLAHELAYDEKRNPIDGPALLVDRMFGAGLLTNPNVPEVQQFLEAIDTSVVALQAGPDLRDVVINQKGVISTQTVVPSQAAAASTISTR